MWFFVRYHYPGCEVKGATVFDTYESCIAFIGKHLHVSGYDDPDWVSIEYTAVNATVYIPLFTNEKAVYHSASDRM